MRAHEARGPRTLTMEQPFIPNPFPPPPRQIGRTLLFFAVAAVALGAGVYLIWTLIIGDPLPPPPSSPVPTAAAESEIAVIATQLKIFQKSVGRYPTVSEGLNALVERPEGMPPEISWPKLRHDIPRDPWGRSYEYVETPGDPPGYRIFSKGPNSSDSSDDISAQLSPAAATPSPPATHSPAPKFR